MMEMRSHFGPDGLLVWGRLLGYWGREECDGLRSFFDALALPRGSHVLLDFSALRHFHFAAAPWLVAMAADLEVRGAQLSVAGLTERMRSILELGAACEAREFCERYGDQGSPLPGPAERGERGDSSSGPYELGPHGFAVVGLN